MPKAPTLPDTYEVAQDDRDRQYQEGWRKAPKKFKDKAQKLGISSHVDGVSSAMALDENFATVGYTVDLAEQIDTVNDRLIETYGTKHADMINAIVAEVQKPMMREIKANEALILGRVASFMINSERANIQARAHQLMHAVPLLAEVNGFPTLRSSARACGVSVEWIRRGRDQWCEHLGIPIPENGLKSDEAKRKYKENALQNHHTKQKYGSQKPTK